MNGPLWLPARAKLNLGLRIVGRRADGYHLLETLFHALELHDDLELQRTQGPIALAVTAEDAALLVTAGPDNLVVRALTALLRHTRSSGGFAARLHKRIPPGGGLGGGSSDAAAALRLGNALLGSPLAIEELAVLAAGLGADVPFFLRGGSQWGRGIGDVLSPADVAPQHFVLVVPPFGCPTSDVYRSFSFPAAWKGEPSGDTVHPIAVVDSTHGSSRKYPNDLQTAAEAIRPELRILRQRVEVLVQREVAMTGSGSTLFVPCDNSAEAQCCAASLASLGQEGVRTLVTRSAADPVFDVPRPLGDSGRGERRRH